MRRGPDDRPLRRRALTFSVLVAAFALGWAGAPLWLALAALVDGVRRRRLATVRFVAFVLGLLACEVVGVVVALGIGGDRLRNYALQRRWASALWRLGSTLWRLKLNVMGDPVPARPFVAFVRHASYADTLLPMLTMAGPARFPRYVLKAELRADPCLDLVGGRVPNVFVRRGAGDEGQLAEVAALASTAGPEDFVVLYPEGTRFTARKREAALARVPEAWRAAATALTHTLPPRPAGALALLDAGLDVVFVAHSGLDAANKLPSLLSGAVLGATFDVHLRHVKAADVPEGPEARLAWLYAEWARVDSFVAAAAAPQGAATR
jgi:1-acyl-sn-glycerol-3-phosphate acyltransferase